MVWDAGMEIDYARYEGMGLAGVMERESIAMMILLFEIFFGLAYGLSSVVNNGCL